MLRLRYILIFVLVLMMAGAASANPAETGEERVKSLHAEGDIVGQAFSIDGKTLLYTERYIQLDEYVWRVKYLSGDDLIADKTINYARGKVQPSFTIKNFWSEEISSVEYHEDKLKVFHGDLNTDKEELDSEWVEQKGLVVDAGFVAFVLDNWDAFKQNDALEYPFLVPSRLSTIKMQTERVSCGEELVGQEYLVKLKGDRKSSDVYACFKTRANNPLLRLLVSDIYLVFTQQDKKLMRFKGLGNIADKDGKMLKVDIRYTYL